MWKTRLCYIPLGVTDLLETGGYASGSLGVGGGYLWPAITNIQSKNIRLHLITIALHLLTPTIQITSSKSLSSTCVYLIPNTTSVTCVWLEGCISTRVPKLSRQFPRDRIFASPGHGVPRETVLRVTGDCVCDLLSRLLWQHQLKGRSVVQQLVDPNCLAMFDIGALASREHNH